MIAERERVNKTHAGGDARVAEEVSSFPWNWLVSHRTLAKRAPERPKNGISLLTTL